MPKRHPKYPKFDDDARSCFITTAMFFVVMVITGTLIYGAYH